MMKNQDIKKLCFQNLDNFHIEVISVNGKSALLIAFVEYTLSKLYRHCARNCNFYRFLGTRIWFRLAQNKQ